MSNGICEIAWQACLAGFLPDATSDAELQPPDMDRAFGETAAAQIKG
jgi:hypothetical protein